MATRMRTAVFCCAVGIAASGCSYKPGSFGSFGHAFPGERMTIGCLDLAVRRRADLEGAAVLEYTFGNRCKRAVPIDLEGIPVVGRTLDGVEVTLTPYDPRLELRPLRLDARLAGSEALAYPATRPLIQVCADIARLSDPGQPARWVCFGEAQQPAAPPAPAAELAAAEGDRTRIDDDIEEAP